ncbi:hypothetical protein F3Y22_tig00003096pilonHSYRG00043 [Hibiscus syriacus]|uniref:RNase H type-1 domain-containing protein n=1 Tax=Hibiscus syriacus TaxID=106335 RepID=A0A6A3CKG9_HIBSY|nr:hypothetical protein F3Y22_tig00003096pilonHSYRG00043 [Hibiscus syriacus]
MILSHLLGGNVPPPPQEWIKAYSDGAVNLGDGSAAAGGVLRNHNGDWIVGFSRSLGKCLVLIAELWGAHDTLVHALRLGFKSVVIEKDNAEVVDIYNNLFDALAGNTLVDALKELRDQDWTTRMVRIKREINGVADKLASMSRGHPIG